MSLNHFNISVRLNHRHPLSRGGDLAARLPAWSEPGPPESARLRSIESKHLALAMMHPRPGLSDPIPTSSQQPTWLSIEFSHPAAAPIDLIGIHIDPPQIETVQAAGAKAALRPMCPKFQTLSRPVGPQLRAIHTVRVALPTSAARRSRKPAGQRPNPHRRRIYQPR